LLSKEPCGGDTDESDCRSRWRVHEVVPPDAKGGRYQEHIERDQNRQQPAVMARPVHEQDCERRMEGRKTDDALDARKVKISPLAVTDHHQSFHPLCADVRNMAERRSENKNRAGQDETNAELPDYLTVAVARTADAATKNTKAP
jgi:hypothetical protein